MAIIGFDDLRVCIREDGRVVLRVPHGGRSRDLIFEPSAAQHGGTLLANAGFDALKINPGFPRASAVFLKPFDEQGEAMLQFELREGGPLAIQISATVLNALAQAAQAALEFSTDIGHA